MGPEYLQQIAAVCDLQPQLEWFYDEFHVAWVLARVSVEARF